MNPQHMLVVANRTCPCPELIEQVSERALKSEDHRVFVLAPALNSRLRHYVSDSDGAAAAADARLAQALDGFAAAGVRAEGRIGDADPLTAIEDELTSFPAQEIIISTYPSQRSNWLESDLIARARDRFGLPVTHLVSEYGQP